MTITVSYSFDIKAAKHALFTARGIYWKLAYHHSVNKLRDVKSEAAWSLPALANAANSARTKSAWCALAREWILALEAEIKKEEEKALARQIEADLKLGRPVCEETGRDLREWSGDSIEADHAEALEINALVDDAVSLSKPFADNAEYDRAAVNNSIDRIRENLLAANRYPARFILKMMISVKRLAKLARIEATANYRAMMERCAAPGAGCNEIPF